MDADIEDDRDDDGSCDAAEIHGGRQKTKRLASVFRLGDLDGDVRLTLIWDFLKRIKQKRLA